MEYSEYYFNRDAVLEDFHLAEMEIKILQSFGKHLIDSFNFSALEVKLIKTNDPCIYWIVAAPEESDTNTFQLSLNRDLSADGTDGAPLFDMQVTDVEKGDITDSFLKEDLLAHFVMARPEDYYDVLQRYVDRQTPGVIEARQEFIAGINTEDIEEEKEEKDKNN